MQEYKQTCTYRKVKRHGRTYINIIPMHFLFQKTKILTGFCYKEKWKRIFLEVEWQRNKVMKQRIEKMIKIYFMYENRIVSGFFFVSSYIMYIEEVV